MFGVAGAPNDGPNRSLSSLSWKLFRGEICLRKSVSSPVCKVLDTERSLGRSLRAVWQSDLSVGRCAGEHSPCVRLVLSGAATPCAGHVPGCRMRLGPLSTLTCSFAASELAVVDVAGSLSRRGNCGAFNVPTTEVGADCAGGGDGNGAEGGGALLAPIFSIGRADPPLPFLENMPPIDMLG